MSSSKTINSRSNKEIGDTIEENWEITAKKVIAEPVIGDRARDIPPRHGIYQYEVKPIIQHVPVKAASTRKQPAERSVGGTRREASTAPLIVRRVN